MYYFKGFTTAEYWASFRGFLVVSLAVLLLWVSNFFLMPIVFSDGSGSTSNAGTAGDMFGGLTALFSGLAFAGLITTLFMQRRELELQRMELSQTRDVFLGSRLTEIRILLFNCASIQGDGMKRWVEKYSLLRHLSRRDFETYEVLVKEYSESAFEHNSRYGNPVHGVSS